jgi:aminoglycoside phosphotransferase (APT) family kinase protein
MDQTTREAWGDGSPTGLDLAALDRYFAEIGVPRSGELRASLLVGGRSNLTYRVGDNNSMWVLRRPPLHGLTPSAHDMAREFRVVSALAKSTVPVATAVTLCHDESVLGAPFQVVAYVAGRVVRSRRQLEALGGADTINGCVDDLLRVLCALHEIRPESVGLADFGNPTGYLERQIRRWGTQWQHVRMPDDDRDRDLNRLHAALASSVPQRTGTAIVHGDYRIDNTILTAEDPCRVRAVVDWEMATLGDPLADTALMCAYRDPALDLILNEEAAWTSPLLPTADELAHRYSIVSGRALAHWGFYMAMAYFKLAVIAAGIEHRGQGGPDGPVPDNAGQAVGPLIAHGLRVLRTLNS